MYMLFSTRRSVFPFLQRCFGFLGYVPFFSILETVFQYACIYVYDFRLHFDSDELRNAKDEITLEALKSY